MPNSKLLPFFRRRKKFNRLLKEAEERGRVTYDEAIDGTIKMVKERFEKNRKLLEGASGIVIDFQIRIINEKGEIHHVNPRNYKEYFDWRSAVFARDGYECRQCGSTKRIEAHHIKQYEFNPDLRADVDNGVTLCHECHKKIPRKRR